jgi:restriction endonuclease S subunit
MKFFHKIHHMLHANHSLHQFANLLQGVAFRGALQDEPAGPVRVLGMASALGDSLQEPLDLPAIDFSGDQVKFRVLPGDLIFRARGVSNQALLVDDLQQPIIVAAPLIRIRVHDPQQVDPAYLQWVLNSGPVQRAIDGIAKGSIVRMVTVSSLRDLVIPLPPMAVQQQIAAFARLQKEEQQLSAALIAKRQTVAEQVLWAKAQEVR